MEDDGCGGYQCSAGNTCRTDKGNGMSNGGEGKGMGRSKGGKSGGKSADPYAATRRSGYD